jgi:transcription elongation factor SPT6
VLAVSWGKGDPQVDAISLVFMDDGGRLREHSKLDNLSDEDNLKEFKSLLERRTPDVIVVGGFSVQTTVLVSKLKDITGEPEGHLSSNGVSAAPGASQASGWGNSSQGAAGGSGWGGSSTWGESHGDAGGSSGALGGGAGTSTGAWGDASHVNAGSRPHPPISPTRKEGYPPVIYVHDDSARIYQHSKRASEEFSALSLTAKYCVGLARYTQSPMNEYAALGRDMAAITYDEDSQQLVGPFRGLLNNA